MMRTLSYAMIGLAVMTAPVFSEEADTSGSYLSVKGGVLEISRGMPFNDDGVMLGIAYGYDMPDNNFAVEAEFNTTVSKATSDTPRYNDLGVSTLAGYAVYRTPGKLYLKGKIGLLYEYLTSSVSGVGTTIDVDGAGIAISYGFGGGLRVGDHLSAEIEYTSIEADIDYISLGLNWLF